MRRCLLVGLTLILLSFGGVTAQDDENVPPQIIETMPLSGEEIATDGAFTLFFDQEMDCSTLDGAISFTPVLGFNTSCEGFSASIDPQQPLIPGTAYTLTISTALMSVDGQALAEPFTLEFRTAAILQVLEVLPDPDTQAVGSDAVVTVIFNRPVVPLVTVDDMADLPAPLTISPAVEGEGEWLNTSIYTFTPDVGWASGTTYTVTVEAGLQSADGALLAAPFSWDFTTEAPFLVSINPQDDAAAMPLQPMIQATFNIPLDQASLEANFYVRPQGTNENVTGTFAWSDDGTGFAFTPDGLLQLNTSYEVGYPGGVVAAAIGNATLPAEQWTFVTVPSPAVIGTDPFDGAVDVFPFGGVRLFFASAMDQESLEGRVTIDPEPWREAEYFYQSYDNSVQVSFPVEPSTDYTITIEPGMMDIYGNTIDTPLSFSFSTAPYSPEVTLQIPDQIGFYNANREETQVFVTHRNVEQLELSLYSVTLPEFASRTVSQQYFEAVRGYTPRPEALLRQWQIPSVAPQNALRYELLSLGSSAEGEASTLSCAGSAPTRLNVGDTAIVISDPDPVRARLSPPDGEIVDLLYRDYALPVVGGPVCASDLLWWEVELRDATRVWVAESIGEEYLLDERVDGGVTAVTIPQQFTNGEALSPGIYYLEVDRNRPPEDQGPPLKHMLVVGTANLLIKSTIDGVIVWATDVETGLPIPNAPITIFDQGYNAVAQGVTDADGIVEISTAEISDLYQQRLVVLDDGTYFGVALPDWSSGIDPWNFGMPSEFYPRSHTVYAYTDRPIYRPDQPVYFRGVVRAKDDVTYTPPAVDTAFVTIFDDQNEVIYTETLPLTEFGTFSASFELAEDAALGFYRLEVTLPLPENEVNENRGFVFFSVAEFRLPEFEVNLDGPEEVVQGDTISLDLNADYFFGGVVSGANVEYNVVANPFSFQYDGPGGRYDFTDFDPDGGPGEFYGFSGGRIADGMGRTDEAGRFTIQVPADLEDSTQSQRFTIEATVRDESEQTVAGRTDVVVHQGEVYIGARPENYVANAGQETTLEFISVDWDSNPVPNQAIAIDIVERRWSSVQEQDASGRTTWTYEVEEIPIETGNVTTDGAGLATYGFTPPTGGIFKVTITTRDSMGNEVRAATTMWVSSREYVSWRQQNSNRIDLIADANDYEVGDTAEILITSPFQGTTEAFITVERGDVLFTDRITMDSNSFVYELPIEADYAPNIYVSAVLVKGVDEVNPVAAFRMGMIQLGVDAEQKALQIQIEPDREQAGPRETVTYTVRTTDFAGNPVQAEVGVGLTDVASLSIAEPNSQPIMSVFYGQQGVAVRTSTALTINTDQITQTVIDTIKGGGGGFGEGGIFDIRQDFVDTAFWDGAVLTDANGVATFEVTLPDNLTRWRLDARAVTRGDDGLTLVGQETHDLQSTKPLLIRPITPRFFVVGDEVILAAIVNNNTEEAQAVEVTLEGSGVDFSGDASQMVTIPAQGGARIEWPVTVQDTDTVDLTFIALAEGGAFNDASKPPLGQGEDRLLPVFNYEAPEIVGTGGVLREAETITETIALPRAFDVTQGELTVELQPSLAATTIDGLDYLEDPTFNTPATVSTLRPNVATAQALQQLGIEDGELQTNLNREIQFAIQRLNARQKIDGGWGWTSRDESDELVTAYAILGLVEAQEAGFVVDPALIGRAQNFIALRYVTPGLNVEDWQLDRQAFLLYVMARSGDADVARTVNLFESRERLSIYAQAFLAQALAIIGGNDDRLNTIIADITSAAIVSANGTHWQEDGRDFFNWNTDNRTTAIVLETLIQLRPDSELLPNVVRWLMVARRADGWATNQETAWVLTALTGWMLSQDELNADYSLSVDFNGDELIRANATPETTRETNTLIVDVAQMLQDEANRLTINRGEGTGNLYYTAYLRAFLPVPEIEALNRGIIVQRRYTLLDDEDRNTITEAEIGQLVQVRLTIIAPNDLYYVVVEDPIPAGTDAVNPNLATEQQIGTRPGLDTSDPLQFGWGWWWFSDIDFRDEKVVLSARYLPAGTYEYVYTIRPGLQGTYNVIPPTGRESYFPDVFGRGEGTTFTILPASE